MCPFPSRRAVAELNTAVLQRNFALLDHLVRRHATGAHSPRTIAVVKANAYGHGIVPTVCALLTAGCSFFAVATAEEAFLVRRAAPKADILILGYTPPHLAPDLAREGLIQTVFSAEYAAELEKYAKAGGKKLRIHLKIDGGMCRLGFSPEACGDILNALTLPHLCAEGIYTHFPSADTDLAATREALLRFLSCKKELEARGFSLFSHAAASAALLTLPEAVLDGARVGLALYGIAPTKTPLPLFPAMTLSAPVVQIHEVPEGTPVGYGGSFITRRRSLIGTLPIGYADGIPRAFRDCVRRVRILTKRGSFFAPVAGNICMDQMMIDLTGIPAEPGDPALFYEDLKKDAAALGTIPYELLVGIGPRIARMTNNRK